jgi:acetolactate synthase regulatory subunit
MIASHHEGKSGVGEGHRGSLICSIDEAQVVKNTHIQILISDPASTTTKTQYSEHLCVIETHDSSDGM